MNDDAFNIRQLSAVYTSINGKTFPERQRANERFNDHHIFNNIICLELNTDDTFYLHCIQLMQSRALENMIYDRSSFSPKPMPYLQIN